MEVRQYSSYEKRYLLPPSISDFVESDLGISVSLFQQRAQQTVQCSINLGACGILPQSRDLDRLLTFAI